MSAIGDWIIDKEQAGELIFNGRQYVTPCENEFSIYQASLNKDTTLTKSESKRKRK
jgi:hypothetical protein